MPWIAILNRKDLLEEEFKVIKIQEHEILLIRFHGKISAFENICTHAAVPLSIGWIEEGLLTCSMHHAQYHPITGEHIAGPGYRPLQRYQIREVNDSIEIEWEDINITSIKLVAANTRSDFLKKLKSLMTEYSDD